jgi:hypothetical protein
MRDIREGKQTTVIRRATLVRHPEVPTPERRPWYLFSQEKVTKLSQILLRVAGSDPSFKELLLEFKDTQQLWLTDEDIEEMKGPG